METIAIPGGWFWMGNSGRPGQNPGQEDERPRHRVWVDAFEIARHQVTNADYARFLQATSHTPSKYWGLPEFADPRQPVVGVSWHDAVAYCTWRGDGYRLPTEAEWEYAARGGRDGLEYPWGDDPPQSRPNYASKWRNSPEPIGTSDANGYGLDAMGENVHEWCADYYDASYYSRSPERNPRCDQAANGTAPRRASRGGSWRHHIKIARCSARSSIPPEFHYADYGFRVVR